MGKIIYIGICYWRAIYFACQWIVEPAGTREYGRAYLASLDSGNILLNRVRTIHKSG